MNKRILVLCASVYVLGCSKVGDDVLHSCQQPSRDINITNVVEVLRSAFDGMTAQSYSNTFKSAKFALFIDGVCSLNSKASLQDVEVLVGKCDYQRMRCRKEYNEIFGNVLSYHFDRTIGNGAPFNYVELYFGSSNQFEGIVLSKRLRECLPREYLLKYERLKPPSLPRVYGLQQRK